MRFLATALSLIVFLLAQAKPAFADGAIAFNAGNYDPTITVVSLLNVGASDGEPWMAGGHLVLRLYSRNHDYAFDWGVFDMSDKNFLINYLMGTQNYYHLVRPTRVFLEGPQYEHRAVFERVLNLTIQQKMRLIAGLEQWALPQNRAYRYKLLDRNCSTAIRDLLIKTLGKGFLKRLQKPAPMSIRDAGLERLGYFPFVYILTTAAGGVSSDLRNKKFDLFYLPVWVPKILAKMPAFNDKGQAIAGSKLLGPEVKILSGDNIPPRPFPWAICFGCILAALIMFSWSIRQRLPRTSRSIAYLTMVLGAFGLGLLGTIIDLLWGVTQHTFTYDNLNVLMFWPLDFLLIGWIVLLIWSKSVPTKARD